MKPLDGWLDDWMVIIGHRSSRSTLQANNDDEDEDDEVDEDSLLKKGIVSVSAGSQGSLQCFTSSSLKQIVANKSS